MDMKTFLEQAEGLILPIKDETAGESKPLVEKKSTGLKLKQVQDLHLGEYYDNHPQKDHYLKNLEVIKTYDPELYRKIVTFH